MGAAGDAVDEGPMVDKDPGALMSPDAASRQAAKAGTSPEGGEWPMRRAASALLVTALVLVAAGVLFLLIKHAVPAVSGWAGAALASSAMAALGWYVLNASDAIEGARRIFGAFGLALVSMWVVATFARVPVRPEEIFNAFLIAGFVLLMAAWAMRYRSRGPWLIGLVAAGSLLLIAASSVAGIVFEPITTARPVQVLIALTALLSASWAGFTIFREARQFRAGEVIEGATDLVNEPPKAIGLIVPLVISAVGIGFGLWYTLMFGPIKEPPQLDVSVEMHFEHSASNYDQIRVEVIASNPTESQLRLMTSPYTVSQAIVRPTADQPQQQVVDCPLKAELRAGGGVECAVAPTTSSADATIPGPTPVTVQPNVAGSVSASSLTSLTPQAFVAVHTGQAWTPGHVIEPGSTIKHSFVFAVPSNSEALRILRFELPLVFGRSDRLIAMPADDACLAGRGYGTLADPTISTYRLLPIDPIAGLIGAFDPPALDIAIEPSEGSMSVEICRHPDEYFSELVEAPASVRLADIFHDWGIGWTVVREDFTARLR